MEEKIWYVIESHSEKFDLPENEKPIKYFLNKAYAEKFTRKQKTCRNFSIFQPWKK